MALAVEIGCRTCGARGVVSKLGEYRDQTHLIAGRAITVRNVRVQSCGCQTFWRIGPMLDLLKAHPRKRVVTWHSKSRKWT